MPDEVALRSTSCRVGSRGSHPPSATHGQGHSDAECGSLRSRHLRENDEAGANSANAVALPFDDESFDVVIIAFMLMFVPDPMRAFREMARVLVPGGRLVVAVWQGLEGNVVYRELVETTCEFADDESAKSLAWPFILGEPGELESIVESLLSETSLSAATM